MCIQHSGRWGGLKTDKYTSWNSLEHSLTAMKNQGVCLPLVFTEHREEWLGRNDEGRQKDTHKCADAHKKDNPQSIRSSICDCTTPHLPPHPQKTNNPPKPKIKHRIESPRKFNKKASEVWRLCLKRRVQSLYPQHMTGTHRRTEQIWIQESESRFTGTLTDITTTIISGDMPPPTQAKILAVQIISAHYPHQCHACERGCMPKVLSHLQVQVTLWCRYSQSCTSCIWVL